MCPCASWSLYASSTSSPQCRGHCVAVLLILSYLFRSLVDRWGTTVEFTTSCLHSSRFSAFRSIFHSRPVHSLMLSSNRFLCLPLRLPSCTVPCRIVLASPGAVKWWQFSQSNRHSTIGTRQTEYHEALPSSANDEVRCDCTFADDGNASWYSLCRVPIVEWRFDCEDCRHLTVVSLHDTGPWWPSTPGNVQCSCLAGTICQLAVGASQCKKENYSLRWGELYSEHLNCRYVVTWRSSASMVPAPGYRVTCAVLHADSSAL